MERIPAELVLEVLQYAGAIVPRTVVDGLCEKIVHEASSRPKKNSSESPSAHQELNGLLHSALKVKAALVLVCKPWHTMFTPFLYSTFHAKGTHATRVFLKTLEMKPDLRTYIRQVIASPVNLESWTPDDPDAIDNLVSLYPDVTQFIILKRDDFYHDQHTPRASKPLIERTRREWNHLRYLMVSSLTWESFVAYVVAIADSSNLEKLHIHRVRGHGMDLTEARGFLPPHRDLFSLHELVISNADSYCLDLLRSYQFSQLRSFTFHGNTDNSTDLALAAFLGPVFYSLEYLSLPYSALHNQRAVLPDGPYIRSTRLKTLTLTFRSLCDASGGPKFPRIPLHKVEILRITGRDESDYKLLTQNGFCVWLGGLCDKRRMTDLYELRMDIVSGELKKEDMEKLDSSLKRLETSFQAKKIVLKVLNASTTTFETLSVALDAARLRIVAE
jgi:hypothetical protein